MKRTLHFRCKRGLAFLLIFAMVFSTIMQFGPIQVHAEGVLSITEAAGWLESAYAEWSPVEGAAGYKAYVKSASAGDWVQLDNELIRQYSGYWRADALGLAAGSYVMKIEAVLSDGSSLTAETSELNVKAHDRSGFAFSAGSPLGTASGAYNNDGTLKSNAQIIYVTPETAKTCTATVNGSVVTGFQAILDAKQKKNTSNDVLDFRIIGCVKLTDLDSISSSSEGIQVKGASAYTNMNITIEGVGEDAAVHGFGFLIRNCGNVELRNFGVLDFMDDGISIDTNNCNLWIHNMDLFYGQAGNDSDQKKGDGSVDIKKSQYCTVSYNHFWDSGKSCLIDASSATSGYADFLTYHHNWFDHSDSRHPRVRNGQNFHIYNNYYDGNAKYGVGVTTGSSVFVEANYFRNCNYPMMSSLQGTDALGDGTFSKESGGIIKAYANYIEGASSYIPYSDTASVEFDAYEVSSRNEQVPSSVTTKAGSVYSNFDTADSMYGYTADTAENARINVMSYAGRMNGGDLKWTFDAAEDTNYAVIPALKSAVEGYKSSVVSIGGYNGGSAEPDPDKPSEGNGTEDTSSDSGSQTPASGSHIHNFTTDGKDSSYFTIAGNLATNKGTANYNGMTLTQCLKMESSTSISFTAAADAKLVLVFADTETGKNVKIDGTKKACTGSVLEMDIAAGTHTVTKGDTMNLFYMAVVTSGDDTVNEPTSDPETDPTSDPNGSTEPDSEKPTGEEGSGSQTPAAGSHIHNFTTDGKDSSYFTIAGNLATNKGTANYNGMTLTQCLKMESSTSISFTAAADAKLVLVFADTETGKKVKVDGTKKACTGSILEMDIAAGTHTVEKADNINLFYMAVITTGDEPTSEPVSEPASEPVSEPASEPVSEPASEPASEPVTEPGLKDFELNMSDLSKAEYTEKIENNGFTVLADASNTVVVDASSKTHEGVKYSNRLKTGGEGTADYRSISFTTQDAATVTMVVVSSSSKESRVMGISDGTKNDSGKLVDFDTTNVGTSVATCKFTVPGAGTYYIHSTSGGLNFYYIKVSYAVSGGTTQDRVDDEVREQAPGFKAGDLYVSTKGKSEASGSFDDPMDLVTALGSIGAGNTIWMFSGTYYAYDMYQAPIIIQESNSGSENAYKTLSSINGRRVTIDFDGMAEEGSNRGITLDGSYWHFYDIDICNAGDNGMLLSGDHNIIELCQFYGNHDTGLQLSRYNTSAATVDLWPSYNLILNCTAYNNKDEATAENADGFAAKLTCGEGNIFDGCISYCNSDDGWDLYAKPATGSIGVVTIRNCVAFGNGKLTDGTGSANGDMNGFKLGGSNKACPTPHIVENCLAFYNGATGFTDNGNGGAVTMTNCTAVSNGVYDANKANFMCYRTSEDAVYTNLLSCASSTKASTDQFLGVLNHVLYNYKQQGYYWVNNWTCTDGAKTKYTGSEANDQTISLSDFVNITVPGYNASTGAYTADYHTIFRNADGSVNLDGLFEVKSDSKLYTAGIDGKYMGAKFSMDGAAMTYTVSVANGTANPVKAAEGEMVTITADAVSGKVFSRWNVKSGNVTLADENSSVTTFTMPASLVEIEAEYKDVPVEVPSEQPSEEPSEAPTEQPSEEPSEAPTEQPSEEPTQTPSEEPTETPAQIPYKAELGEISDDIVTEEIKKATGCETAEDIKAYLKAAITESTDAGNLLEGVSKENTYAIDVTVLISLDGGETWKVATEENFPKNGVDVVLPYPAGVQRDNVEFIVGHMITVGYNGIAPGTMEYYTPEKITEGLKIHINSASPFIIGWKLIETEAPNVTDDDTDDDTPVNDTQSEVTESAAEENVNTESTQETTETQQETTVQEQNDIPATGDVMGGNANILIMMLLIAGMSLVISLCDRKRVR